MARTHNPIYGSFGSPVHQVVLPFIRQEGLSKTTIAVTRLEFAKKTSSQAAAKALVSSVSKWVKDTVAGKDCWKQSCADLNIGDLALCEVQFNAWLKNNRQTLRGFAILYLGDASEGCLSFDKVLAEGVPDPKEME
jgi:hypothetical protein